MANIANMNIGIGADIKPLQSGLDKAQKQITSFSEGVESRLNSISTDRLRSGLSGIGADAVPAANKLASSLDKARPRISNTTSAVTNLNRVIQDAPFGIIGVANNIEPLIQSFNSLRATTGSTTGALKTLLTSAFTGPGALITVTSLASTALLVFGDRLFQTKEKADELTDTMKNMNDSWQRVIELQREFVAFEDDSFGMEENQAKVREITEDMEEIRDQMQRVREIERRRGQIIARNTDLYGNLTAQGRQQLETLDATVGNLRSQESLQKELDRLQKERQSTIEELVKIGDALADSDTQQARESQKTAKSKQRQLEFEQAIAEARRAAMQFQVQEDEIIPADIQIPELDMDLGEQIFPAGSLGALQERLSMLRSRLQFATDPAVISGLQSKIQQTEESIDQFGQSAEETGQKAAMAMGGLGNAVGGVVGQLIAGKKEALSFGNILASVAPALINVLTGGSGGFVASLASGIFGGAFHSGGVVPGPLGKERLVLAQGGETIRTPRQERNIGGGSRTINIPLYLDGRQIALAQTEYSEKISR